MHLFLQPRVISAFKKTTIAMAIWLGVLVALFTIAHPVDFSPQVYTMLWHDAAAHSAWCIPIFSVIFPPTVTTLLLAAFLAAYRSRWQSKKNLLDELKLTLHSGPMLKAAFNSKLDSFAQFAFLYFMLAMVLMVVWTVEIETLMEMATALGVCAFFSITYVWCLDKGWFRHLNPITLFKNASFYIRQQRLGNRFDLLPPAEKEAFRKEAALVGLSVHDKSFQLAAVQVYAERVRNAHRQAKELSNNTPDAQARPKPRL